MVAHDDCGDCRGGCGGGMRSDCAFRDVETEASPAGLIAGYNVPCDVTPWSLSPDCRPPCVAMPSPPERQVTAQLQ